MAKTRVPMNYWNRPAIELAIAHPTSAANCEAGYIRISRDNKVMYLHIWLWEELVGPIPAGYEIDHFNGIRTDCRLSNLRCIPKVINLRNSKKRSDNASGKTGVSFWKAGNAWRASSSDPKTGKQICKTFSVKKYGYETARFMASKAREDMIQEHNKNGAGYSPRHGR